MATRQSGRADAEATCICGADPEFYASFHTLESYNAIGDNTNLMIDADSDFFRYLQASAQP